jgi:hypothetical protein
MDTDYCPCLRVPFGVVAHTNSDAKGFVPSFIDLLVEAMGGPLTAEEIQLCETMTNTEFDEFIRRRMLP